MKDGQDDNKSFTASGIHKSRMLHPDKKKNNNICVINHERWER
jgi:hypothetical protein